MSPLICCSGDMDMAITKNSFAFADVGMGGRLKYVADPESIISGTLHGKVTVLGVGFWVDLARL